MEYVTGREFESRMGRLETKVDAIDGKMDQILARETVQATVDSKAVAKKAAMHVSWLTPVAVAIVEAIKAAFK